MTLWGNQDQYSDAPKFTTSANSGASGQEQYGNTVFGVSAIEAEVNGGPGVGWVKRVEKTGDQTGRVQEEVLVALSSQAFLAANGTHMDATDFANTDAVASANGTADDAVYPDA